MFIGSKAPIMSAKEGGIYMDKFLKSFYDEHFVNRENNKIEDTAEYYFLTGIQLGIEITRTKHPDLTVEQIMQLLHQIKEDNSC